MRSAPRIVFEDADIIERQEECCEIATELQRAATDPKVGYSEASRLDEMAQAMCPHHHVYAVSVKRVRWEGATVSEVLDIAGRVGADRFVWWLPD